VDGPSQGSIDASLSAVRQPIASRRRGRPVKMTRGEILEKIRQLARRKDGLFRVHRTQAGLYARARRMFGSWSAAVAAAGIDCLALRTEARVRSVRTRRRRRMAGRPHRASPSGP